MKLLTIAIPCYNSQEYMRKSVDSLLIGGDDVEILIINDGSQDRTAEIANEYEKNYPGIIRAIHKENGGHGSAVNAGMREARGLYFKVVDSDDWVNEMAYRKVLSTLDEFAGSETRLDMLVSNFIYNKVGEKRHKVMQYRKYLPVEQVFTWKEMKNFPVGKYILMHSVIFRTKLLRECGLQLPEHTFYVDNLYVFEPLLFVKNMYYLDVNFYSYYIGRDDQSVHESVMMKRIDQQLKVNKIMVDFYSENYEMIRSVVQRRHYMYNYLEIITMISSVLLINSGKKADLEKKKELWSYIRDRSTKLYLRLRFGLGNFVYLPGRGGRNVTIGIYKILQRIYHFN
ncbi:MAG: glycosyltransferase family 2 protein [Lachnospiraceae bacterium]|nr:glycosyltransferase family 2 protein [Lachnospiraceae bacterium]